MPKDAKETDPHRHRLYQWEADWPDWNKDALGIKACRAAVRKACKHYKVRAPRVVHTDTGSLSFSVPSKNFISLHCGGMNIPTALHEAAHHIAYALHGETVQDHGPTFLGIYIGLLERAGVAPRTALEASARAHGLKWR